MSGLTNATSGLSYGVGLIYPIVPENLTGVETFAGVGTLSVDTSVARQIAATFGGAGALSASTTFNLRAAATFAGAGSVSEFLVNKPLDIFGGTGGLSASARLNAATAATFAGSGGLSASALLAAAANVNFAGSGAISTSSSFDTRSLTFTAASSQYLSRTGSTSINQQKFTVAFWFKRASTGALMYCYGAGDLTTLNRFQISFTATDEINIVGVTAASTVLDKLTNATYTDTNWHNLCCAVDTTQATAANRVRLYIDGTEVLDWDTNTIPSQNANLSNNYATTYAIGQNNIGLFNYFNGNLDEYYYIDGQQLTPSSFITGTPGIAKPYTGTYTGIFDFYLSFENNASTTTLGSDGSGEGNNWTLNNMTTGNSSTDHP